MELDTEEKSYALPADRLECAHAKYNVLYRCKVTGAESNSFPFALGSGKVPVKCDTGAANCTKGPKQPMVGLIENAIAALTSVSLAESVSGA